MSKLDVHFSSKSIEWGTPDNVLDLVRASGYDLQIDVCATPGREKCSKYFGPPEDQIARVKNEETGAIEVDPEAWERVIASWKVNPPIAVNALAQDWASFLAWSGGVAWMNPPFGRAISGWVAKAASEARRGACVVCLLPARTDTAWWHDHVEPVRLGLFPGELVFWRGRITFIDADGLAGDPAPFPCAIVVFDGRKLPR